MSAKRAVIWKRTSWKSIKEMMSSAGCCSLGWGCPSASIEDIVKSFELIVMPRLRNNKLARCKGCIMFVQSPKVCVVAIASGYNASSLRQRDEIRYV